MFQDDSSVFSGDCILGEGTAVFEDLFDYMKSLKLILGLSPPKIFPGHGNIIEDPVEKIKFYIEHRNQREQQILDVLKSHPNESFTSMDIVKKVYSEIAFYLRPAANKNVSQHLIKLVMY
jgi:ribonuclease/clavin/mitogillin